MVSLLDSNPVTCNKLLGAVTPILDTEYSIPHPFPTGRKKRGEKRKKESAREVISLDYSSKVEYYLLCSSSRVCVFTTILKIKIFMSGFKSNGDTTLLDGIE